MTGVALFLLGFLDGNESTSLLVKPLEILAGSREHGW